jgi:hypothetical protein
MRQPRVPPRFSRSTRSTAFVDSAIGGHRAALWLASWASRLLGLNEQAVAFGKESLGLRRAEEDRHGEAESLALRS